MPAKNPLQEAIEKAAQNFAAELLLAIRNATVDDIASLTEGAAAPAKDAAPEAEAAPVKKPRKKRAWPTCSVDGCEKNVYMPSGAKKMCYAHHMEAGGKPSPLVGVHKKKKKAAVKAKPAKMAAPKAAPKAVKKEAAPAVEAAPEKKARKKRAWPTCTVDGCTKNVYMPSGDKKMCYAHHLEAGGKESPLVAATKKRKAAAKKAPARKKAVVRKAGQTSLKSKK